MKTCFVNLPWEVDNRRGIRAGCRFPNLTAKNTNAYVPFPFLLAYAASYSQSRGAEVLCIDGIAERSSIASVCQRIQAFQPDLVVAEISTSSLHYDLEAILEVRSGCPNTRIAIYGSHVHERPQDGLACAAVDYIIHGEPEITSFELLKAIVAGQDVNSVAGLTVRHGPDRYHKTPSADVIHDLDDLPYPIRVGLPMHNYNVPGFPSPMMFVYGSRGCPFKCNFCLWPQTNLKGNFRTRSGEKIAEEIDWLLQQFPDTRSFFFDDDTFNLGRERILRFADEMTRRQLRVAWGMNARADNWDRELMERLVETGLFTLRIGVESGDQAVLDRTQKDLRLDQVRQTLEMAHGLGIKNHVSFIIGLPGETEASVDNTIRFIKSLPVDSVQFSVAIPFPGTGFYREVEARGHLLTHDWRKFNGFEDVVIRTDAMSPEAIQRALVRARRSVYFSPRFIRRRLGYVRDFRDLRALARKAWRLVVQRAS